MDWEGVEPSISDTVRDPAISGDLFAVVCRPVACHSPTNPNPQMLAVIIGMTYSPQFTNTWEKLP